MLNSGQEHQGNNFKHSSSGMDPKNSYIETSIDELGQMMSKHRISNNLSNGSTYTNQPPRPITHLVNSQYKPNYPQPIHFKTHSQIVPNMMSHNIAQNQMMNQLKNANISQSNKVNPMSHISQQPNINLPNYKMFINQQPIDHQMNHQINHNMNANSNLNPMMSRNLNASNTPCFVVPNIHKYLNPNYENLNAHTYANQPISNQLHHNPSTSSIPSIGVKQSTATTHPSLSGHQASNQQIKRDLISPNITGLPEAMVRRTSPSCQDIYANSSIVSRYVPAPSSDTTTEPKYQSLNNDLYSNYSSSSYTLNSMMKDNASSMNNELGSLYDPVYRPNSQLSFNSTKDDSITYSSTTYAPSSIRSVSTTAAAGSRQPINVLLNIELDPTTSHSDDKSVAPVVGKPRNENIIIDHLKKEKEVDYLTDLLVKGMSSSNDPDFFGMCYKCGQVIKSEGCTVLGHIYHTECFSCYVCDKTLRGIAFYQMDGRPYCEEDYLNTLEKCFVCSKPILDRVLRAMGNLYHPNCFCCVVCGKCLDGIHFTVDHKNLLHCIEDFHDKFAPRCSVCSKPIIPENGQLETVRIVALDRIFHVKCYKCEDCGALLSSEKDGKGCYPLDDHILCKACNNSRFQQYLSSN